jgi:hypothetical protein
VYLGLRLGLFDHRAKVYILCSPVVWEKVSTDKNWAGGNGRTSRIGQLKAGVIDNSARCLVLLLLILQLIRNEEIQIIPHCYSWPASKSFFQRNWQHRSLHNNRITRETMNEFKFTKTNILFTHKATSL